MPSPAAPERRERVPEEGQLVSVRDRLFVVTNVVADALAHDRDAFDQIHLVQLASVEDDGLGEALDVVWEIEPGRRILERSTLPSATGLDDPQRLDAVLDAVR